TAGKSDTACRLARPGSPPKSRRIFLQLGGKRLRCRRLRRPYPNQHVEEQAMRIAAGVLIIIVSILDLFSGVGYAFVGGAATALGTAGQQIAQHDPAVKQAET